MRIWFFFVTLVIAAFPVYASGSFSLPVKSGEEVTVNVYLSTFGDSNRPLVVWFTEGYASRQTFKQIMTQFNDAGYELWQVDLLDSYFIERTPTNIRGLTGEGVASVLEHANQQGRPFVAVSSGRMSLPLLRGARLWQLENKPEKGIGNLQQVVTFFPNVFDAPKKAGDVPELFPIVSSSSLPITVIQPTEGAFKWKLPDIINALQANGSQVAVVAASHARDWYFVKDDGNDLEKQAAASIADRFEVWLKAGQVAIDTRFKPVEQLATKRATVSLKGLVQIANRAAANFELTDISGKTIHLTDKRGKVILLNFWASWCAPCVKEIPSMNRLAESFDRDQFEIVSVNFKESPETIAAFFKQVQVDFPVLIDLQGKVANQYEIFAFPSSFIIDAHGNLRYSVNAAIEWDEPQIKSVIDSLITD